MLARGLHSDDSGLRHHHIRVNHVTCLHAIYDNK
jgi:hypothetical protein